MGTNFKSGDSVRFLNDVGGGIINRIDNEGVIYVQTEDGFEIPVTAKELVHSGNFISQVNDEAKSYQLHDVKTENNKIVTTEKSAKMPRLPSNLGNDLHVDLLLGFVPENPGPVFNNRLECFLINDSKYFTYYVIGTLERNGFYYITSGLIEAETKYYIHTFDQTSISKLSGIHIQAILFSDGKYNRKAPVDKVVDLNRINFSKESYFRENEYFNRKAVIFHINEANPADNVDKVIVSQAVINEKEAVKNDERFKKKKEPVSDTLEVDLHVDASFSQNSQYTPANILALQMSRFHAAVDEAISKNIHRLVIIHGIGQGTLKMEIRKELQKKYPNFVFQDASFKEYGFGATLVHLITDKKQ
jgi:hypothetical protein